MPKRLNYIVLLTLFWACSTNPEPDASRLGLDYFPLQKGKYWVYEVNSIDYLVTGGFTEKTIQLKIQLADSFLLNYENQWSYVAYLFERENESQAWSASATQQLYRNQRQGVWVEQNNPFLKLSFPFSENKSWNGNALNSMEAENYQLEEVFRSFVMDADTFPNTVTVIQADNNDSIISLDRRIEVYAQDIGLVYKLFSQIDFCNDIECLGLGEIDFGTFFSWKLIEYGQE